jgi:hypothetical protein
MVGELLMPAYSHNLLSFADLTWIRAFTFLETTSIQWFVIGCLVDFFRQRRATKRRTHFQRLCSEPET